MTAAALHLVTDEEMLPVVVSKPKRTRKPAAKAVEVREVPEVVVPKVKSDAWKKRQKRQTTVNMAIGGVILLFLGISIPHLAKGITMVTGADTIEAWTFAFAIDIANVVAELAMLFAATDLIKKQVAFYGKPFLVTTLIISMVMNAFAFTIHAQGLMVYLSAAFGVAIPLLIYGLTQMGASLFVGTER